MIKLITFKTNQTLMGDVEELESTIKIRMPVQTVMQPSPQGPSLAFIPFLEYAEEWKTGISISKNDILTINSPVDQVINEYNKIFGSGIQIATSMPKL